MRAAGYCPNFDFRKVGLWKTLILTLALLWHFPLVGKNPNSTGATHSQISERLGLQLLAANGWFNKYATADGQQKFIVQISLYRWPFQFKNREKWIATFSRFFAWRESYLILDFKNLPFHFFGFSVPADMGNNFLDFEGQRGVVNGLEFDLNNESALRGGN